MADPIPTALSLSAVSSAYSVFERDQVLTANQLNSVGAYLDDQDRLTRVFISGVGIVGGLHVSIDAGRVKVSKGLGITTDGDLVYLATETLYDAFKTYDTSAPHYEPFYAGPGGTMLALRELVAEGVDDPNEAGLASLPRPLSEYVVCLYMESYGQDHDLCNAADCDNAGITATHAQRVLLVHRSEAAALTVALPTTASVAAGLPWLAGDRVGLSSAIDSTGKLAALYRASCATTHQALMTAVPLLQQMLPNFVSQVFGSNPAPTWTARLDQINRDFAGRDADIQYYYAFLKDVAETWNELCDTLARDASVSCPSVAAFPKHLLLGDLSDPTQSRAPFYPSELSSSERVRERAIGLAHKLQTLILAADFTAPPVVVSGSVVVAGETNGSSETRNILASVRITPGAAEHAPLEERAIPIYYRQNPQHPVLPRWNWRPMGASAAARVAAYRWAEYTGAAAPDFMARRIGSREFFRIEGHLGQPINDVAYTLERDVERFNLPIKVVSVLLHNDKKKVVRKPPRYTDLHRLHYLLRKDVEAQLKFSRKDNSRFRTAALSIQGADTGFVERQYQQIEQNIDTATAPLRTKRYSSYKQTLSDGNSNWKSSYRVAVEGVGTLKQSLGERVKAEYPSPFDSVIGNNNNLWLDWLDTIIGTRDEQADAKLLLPGFLADHPGIEHQGGVARGGTFVLVYDDKGVVVADFALPYRVEDKAEPEPDEPDLPIPDRRPADVIDLNYRVVEPLDDRLRREFENFEIVLEPKWRKEITIQQDYTKFFKESLSTLTEVFGKGSNVRDVTGVLPNTADAFLDAQLAELETTKERLDKLRTELGRDELTADARAKFEKKLAATEQALGDLVTETTRYMVEAKVDVAAGSPAADAVQLIGESVVKVKDSAAVNRINDQLGDIANGADAGQRNIVNRIQIVGGLRRN
jgi:hypothetical protein